MFIKRQLKINEEKGKKKVPAKRRTEVKVLVEVANELDTKKTVLEFYKVVKSERL